MQLEIEDIQQFIPQIANDLRIEITKALEEERFISYRGMAHFLFSHEIDYEERSKDRKDRTHYQRIKKFWDDPKFPKIQKNGIEGVMLSDFKKYFKC
jgi:hypothetical protein